MSTHAAVAFRKELDKLFRRRTHWLNAAVQGPRPGAPPALSRGHVRNSVARLQQFASDALAEKLARHEFDLGVRERRSWHCKRGKGRGVDNKRTAFNAWFDNNFGSGNYIYVFWKSRRCVYVGKTRKSGRRISGHFEKHWFALVTRVDVYQASGRRVLPALECLAIHRFLPARNKSRAETKRWTSKCSLCRVHRQIDQELGKIFRLR
jgi:hypothetical protein